MEATYFGANGWLLDWSGLRVLVDPWFCGPLVFPPGPWFFQGQLSRSFALPSDLDLLLLTRDWMTTPIPRPWRCCPVPCPWWAP